MIRSTGSITRAGVTLGAIAVALVLAGGGLAAAAARETAPVVVPARGDYPELRIEVGETGFAAPTRLPAGRYLLTVDNPRPDGITITLVRPPAGRAVAEARRDLADPNAPPAWLYEATVVGGPYAVAGASARGIVDLSVGDWLIWGGRSVAFAPPLLRVTDGASATPSTGPEPAVGASIDLREYGFFGLEQGVATGPQIWRFANTGDQPHLMDLIKAPGALTQEQLLTLLALPEGAAPPAGLPSLDEFAGVAGIGTLSPGQTAWLVLPDLTPGTYVALCFVPDREVGAPHAFMGMAQVFTVGEPGGATP